VAKASKLKDYLAMQCIKRSSTLRILEKDEKPAPIIVYKFGSQNQAIKDFLEYRAMVKKIAKEVKYRA
jgi:hypothetical protein